MLNKIDFSRTAIIKKDYFNPLTILNISQQNSIQLQIETLNIIALKEKSTLDGSPAAHLRATLRSRPSGSGRLTAIAMLIAIEKMAKDRREREIIILSTHELIP